MKNIIFLTFVGFILDFFKSINTIYAAPNYISDKDGNKNIKLNNHINDAGLSFESNDNLNYEKKNTLNPLGLELKDTCKNIAFETKSEITKKCVLDKLKETRCSDANIICLCDSKASHKVIHDCSQYPQYDITFDISFNKLCFSAIIDPDCSSLTNPSFPTVICKDPFEETELNEDAKECIERAVKHSMCKNVNDASCLCDSRSFNYEVSVCIKDVSFGEKVGSFLNTLCNTPALLPGCSHPLQQPLQTIESEKNNGKRLYKIKMKETMFLIFGIIIPIIL
ncbi:hypothetical protein T552_02964 [Pneumocystis carinii B80]|uniref:CFEM domain-containing protein n=1 Tax=Pneumocystis carinii (strain B80) TaxID=1408658 RepID=A0A0W4ZDQ2_PNEC8|nr:hypothetical protein T552_02964 [Pneumocystis carinii B80]KTW26483.1 hypothetical protein T552_02964 [Pneumocystis carinii B80]